MNSDAVIWFLVIGSSLCGIAGIALVALRWIPGGPRLVEQVLGGQYVLLALLCATGMLVGSLYMSEIADFIPCRFCWYQRIAAYPIVVILGFGLARRDRDAWFPAMTLAGIGLGLSLYHQAMERGIIEESSSCDPAAPCTLNWLDAVGVPFVTIPFMAMGCFVFILGLGLHALHRTGEFAPELTDEYS